MAFPQPHYLAEDDVDFVLGTLPADHLIDVVQIRYKNKVEIRKILKMAREELRDLIHRSMEDEHQFGGDMEVGIPELQTTLVGHHDGVYWLEPGVPGLPKRVGEQG